MSQFPISSDSPAVYTVSQISSYIKNLLESDDRLTRVWIKGEISDFKSAYSGHLYFKLKDTEAVINCVMFKNYAGRMNFEIKNGMKVLVLGGVSLYPKSGAYQLYIEQIRPDGLGELFLQFLQLKEKLEKKGYFSTSRKKPLPFLPQGIGIATSSRGAALHDMITTIQGRFPPARIFVSPTVVQGDDAPDSIVNSIKLLNSIEEVDVIIVARGGGSFEDLNCFNSEKVADAIYKSQKPVISGVGHETDVTISDMVADFRSPTPTGAAQKVVPRLTDLLETLENHKLQLIRGLRSVSERMRERLQSRKPDKIQRLLINRINSHHQTLDRLSQMLNRNIKNKTEKYHHRLEKSHAQLRALSPRNVMNRGYAVITRQDDNSFITRPEQLMAGDELNIFLQQGRITASVWDIAPHSPLIDE